MKLVNYYSLVLTLPRLKTGACVTYNFSSSLTHRKRVPVLTTHRKQRRTKEHIIKHDGGAKTAPLTHQQRANVLFGLCITTQIPHKPVFVTCALAGFGGL